MKNKIEIIKLLTENGASKDRANEIIGNSSIYSILHRKVLTGRLLTDEDWQQIHTIINEALPGFYHFISAKQFSLNDNEYRTCILIRLNVPPMAICNLIGVSEGYITKIRKHLLLVLFGTSGKAKDFYIEIKKIC